jgi:uncharacterized protein YbjT (DUF2867 family)
MLRVIGEAERRGRAIPNFGRSAAPFNVVPVDFVVEAIAAAAADPAAAGETLHLVDPEPLTAAELTRVLSTEYAGRPPQGRIPPRVAAASLRLPAVRNRLGGVPAESIAYLNHPVRFDTRRAVDLLGPHELVPPPFTDYAAAMVSFFRAHEDEDALRPRH